jgi:uncharacterized protein (TIGR02594 family)
MAPPKKPVAPDDPVPTDTRFAPWMKVAYEELGKKIHELPANDGFVKEMRGMLQMDARLRTIGDEIGALQPALLGDGTPSRQPTLGVPRLRMNIVAELERGPMERANPEIAKYFNGLKSDPAYDTSGKKKSYDISPTMAGSEYYAGVTPWCAAFVNWCLKQANAPFLNYATAKSWLGFGTPVTSPVYGCITVIKPGRSTGSTTGHVAFYLGDKGSKVVLLGGNQSDSISVQDYPAKNVLGHRWPTTMNDYLSVSMQSVLLFTKREIGRVLSGR